MKVLFICFANVARSQIAEACFKTISRHHCDSAGIAVDDRIAKGNLPTRKVKDAPTRRSIEYIKREFEVDIVAGNTAMALRGGETFLVREMIKFERQLQIHGCKQSVDSKE